MTISELANKRVKLSAHTITIKDEANKTRGMIRNVNQFSTASLKDQSANFKAIKSSGIWDFANTTGINILSRIYIVGNKIYLLRDIGYEDNYNRYFAGRGLETDDKHYNLLQQAYASAEKSGIIIVPCNIC